MALAPRYDRPFLAWLKHRRAWWYPDNPPYVSGAAINTQDSNPPTATIRLLTEAGDVLVTE